MTRSLTPKLGLYAALGAAGMLYALLFGRPEAVALGLPFALYAALALALSREPAVDAVAVLDRERILEGEEALLEVRLNSPSPVRDFEVEIQADSGLAIGRDGRSRVSLAAGEPAAVQFPLRAGRWGLFQLGGVRLRARDPFGLFLFERRLARPLPLRVYPGPRRLQALLVPRRTQTHAGNSVSRDLGAGIEFAGVRAFAAGDRVRNINWRVSARRGELHVNQHHPERNTDVVIFIDTFDEVGDGGRSTFETAVRGAAALAARYLETRDRVGLIGFGGVTRWLRPGMGPIQLYRLLDSLLDTRVVASQAWKGIEVIPARTLPPQALLLALTPLLDERTLAALLDARGRGFDVAVIEVDPTALVSPRPDAAGELAFRLWEMRRESARERLREMGIPVGAWNGEHSLEAVLEEVRLSRRHAARAHA